MSYIGAQPTTASFPFDQFSGNGSTTVFTMSYAPASTTSMVVCISGVVQNPNTYNISGLTLTFTQAPPTGTNNIGILYLGLPVQVGVPTPGSTVQFALGSAANPSITFLGDTNTGIYSPGADTLAFVEGGTEVMRFDSFGNVGVGTSAPDNIFHVAKASTSTSVGSSTSTVKIQNTQSSALGETSGVEFFNRNPLGSAKLAGVYGVYENYNATGYAGALAFATESIGAANVTERMRIDSSGNLLVGTTSTIQSGTFSVLSSTSTASLRTTASAGSGIVLDVSRTSATGDMAYFRTSSTTLAGYITCPTGTTTSYASVSDYRLKEDIAPMTGALDVVTQLKPCTYKWKSTGEDGQGFIAHELQAVVPDCVAGEKDAVNEDGSIKPQAIDTSFLVATLTAAIQELKAELDVCKAEIAALKGV